MARIGPYHFRNNQWKAWSKREEKRGVIDKRSGRPIILFLILVASVSLTRPFSIFSIAHTLGDVNF
jgi:hypothetical protein